MGQQRLNMLSLMNIEKELVGLLSFTDLIANFAMRKIRKLIYLFFISNRENNSLPNEKQKFKI